GGRYDNMVEELGGPPRTPAMGFALGLERLVMSIPKPAEAFDPGLDLFMVTHGGAARDFALAETHRLRLAGYRAELSHKQASVKSQMKRADKLRARVVVLVGDDELAKQAVKLRVMAT